uniref:Centrosomal protein of 170 kDa-like n=1 Tax=Saccoglossus kowalevskii TaxID=10224 RepID=A0ABM0MCR0_SACKO|nr:PREDICTED: centrosomal protein of 170 kDa-like [Saccoglossus kowalevskii]
MAWCLVSSAGTSQYLQPSMMFIGREDCEIILQSHSIDKRHAVINFDQFDNVYTLKDVGSLNGTFVNESRIPEQTYVTLQGGDTIRFGYDPHVYRFEKAGRVDFTDLSPVNDKNMDNMGYTEQETIENTEKERNSVKLLQKSRNSPSNGIESDGIKESGITKKSHLKKLLTPGYHGSPLYGQPAWWGEEKEDQGAQEVPAQKIPNGKNEKSVEMKSLDNNEKIYHRTSTDLKPAEPKQDELDESQINIVTTGEKHASFTIEFNEKDATPKLGLQDSLSKFIPSKVREKIDENGRIMEEKRILRKIEEHLDMKPERLPTGRNSAGMRHERAEKYRQRKIQTTDMLTGDVLQSDSDLDNVMESDELVDRIFTENRSSRPKSSTGSILEHVEMNETVATQQYRSYKTNSLSRSKSMPSSKTKPRVHRKMPHHPQFKEQDEDNISETGTYTIQGDRKSKEELEARKKIDVVFGIHKANMKENTRNSGLERKPENITETVVNTHKAVSPNTSPDWGTQWSGHNGKETQMTEKIEEKTRQHAVEISKVVDKKSDEEKSPSKESLKLLQRKRSRGRMLPRTPSGDSPTVSQRSTTPSDYSQYSNASDKDREDLSIVSDIVSPTSTAVNKPKLDSDAISIDTNILLQDTETVMATIQNKYVRHYDECPSLDASFAESSFDDYSMASSEMDIESDFDTSSNVSLVDGDSCTSKPKTPRNIMEGSNSRTLTKHGAQSTRTSKTTATPRRRETTRKPGDSTRKPPSESSRKPSDSSSSAVWNRLSKPNRHKMKDGSVVSDCLSDSTKTISHRNSSDTLSKKSRTSPTIQPRQTRTTALRKSRFGDKDRDSGSELTDHSARSSPEKRLNSSTTSVQRKRETYSNKDRPHRGPPRTTHRTKLGETDWKSETSLGGVIVKKAMENRASSSQNLANTTKTSSVDKLRFGSGPSAFKPVTSKEESTYQQKKGSSWRRYESSDAYSVSDSESTQTTVYDRHSNSVSEPEDNYDDIRRMKGRFDGKHAAEIAKISSTLADDLSKMAKGATINPIDASASRDNLLFYYVSLLDDMFTDDITTTPSSISGRSTVSASTTASSPDNRKKESSVSRSTSFTMGTAKKRPESLNLNDKYGLESSLPKRKQWQMEPFDNLVLSSIHQLSIKLKKSAQRVSCKVE